MNSLEELDILILQMQHQIKDMMDLNIARGAHAVDESVLKTEINAKGNAVMKLESLARMNGFESLWSPLSFI